MLPLGIELSRGGIGIPFTGLAPQDMCAYPKP